MTPADDFAELLCCLSLVYLRRSLIVRRYAMRGIVSLTMSRPPLATVWLHFPSIWHCQGVNGLPLRVLCDSRPRCMMPSRWPSLLHGLVRNLRTSRSDQHTRLHSRAHARMLPLYDRSAHVHARKRALMLALAFMCPLISFPCCASVSWAPCFKIKMPWLQLVPSAL